MIAWRGWRSYLSARHVFFKSTFWWFTSPTWDTQSTDLSTQNHPWLVVTWPAEPTGSFDQLGAHVGDISSNYPLLSISRALSGLSDQWDENSQKGFHSLRPFSKEVVDVRGRFCYSVTFSPLVRSYPINSRSREDGPSLKRATPCAMKIDGYERISGGSKWPPECGAVIVSGTCWGWSGDL